MSDLSLSVSDALVETVAHLVARRVADLLTKHDGGTTPWMTTDEAIAYTRIPAGTFEKLSARGRIPFHAADSGRRKLYHREELDAFLGYERLAPDNRIMRLDAA